MTCHAPSRSPESRAAARRCAPRLCARLLLSLLALGCTLGPRYERPPAELPVAFDATAGTSDVSLAERDWWELFEDPELAALLAAALERGFEPRIAAARVMEAEAQLGIASSRRWPEVSVGGSAGSQGRESGAPAGELAGPGGVPTGSPGVGSIADRFGQLQASVSWSLDFWGRYRSASEAARARWLASEWGRRAAQTTLVSQLATAYFELRTLQHELEIAQRTQAAREESLRLAQLRERGGTGALVDVRQAEQLVYGAAAQVVDFERRIPQQENLLRTLLGDPSQPLPPPTGRWGELAVPAQVPAGLPAALLERRPDVLEAEEQLIAAHADVVVARTAYLPDVTLTSAAGWQSAELGELVQDGSLWSLSAGALQPVFNAGRIRSQVNLAGAQRVEAELRYRQTTVQAFLEVSSALVGQRQSRQLRSERERVLRAAQEASKLAGARYEGGVTSYLEVLIAEGTLLDAELQFAEANLAERVAWVELYRALGGGWQP